MSEEESKSVEAEIEEEPAPQIDVLERINDNLESIRGELEKQNKTKLRENVRLGALIVLFAVPLSFMINVTSAYYAYEFFPEVGIGGWYSNLHGLTLLLMISAIMLVSYRVFSPLIQSVDDQEVKDLMKTLKEEGKKK
uniref:Uncharacterized protein n=1 Tax=uncultured marine group II/III euryarchaeote AD1000_65_H04 TaxID=1457796 RepID=A0A075FUQ5_9EURY|nr:hypothetical protein [uncultured marine group II/III euryarchaeote AD1000_65_H04]